jgi:hypothetical protein
MGRQDIGGEEPTTGGSYAGTILGKWLEIVDIGEKFRQGILSKNYDADIMILYIAKITRLWLELRPKVSGRSFNDKTLGIEFE